MAIKLEPNHRGFPTGKFKDWYKKDCTIQKSSLAEDQCIWLGIDDADPKIMAIHAQALGIEAKEENGWVDYPIPKVVSLRTRMHLSRENVAELLPLLQNFVETGEL